MNILFQILSWLLILIYSAVIFLFILIGGFNPALVIALALPVLILLLLLYTGPSKHKRLFIVLAWLLMLLVGGGFYMAIAMINWR